MKTMLVLAAVLAFAEGERTHCDADTIMDLDDESGDELAKIGRAKYVKAAQDPTKGKIYTADKDEVAAAEKRASDAEAQRKAGKK